MEKLRALTEDEICVFSDAKNLYFETGDEKQLRRAFEYWTGSIDYYINEEQLKILMRGVNGEDPEEEVLRYIMNKSIVVNRDGRIDFIEFFRIVKLSQ